MTPQPPYQPPQPPPPHGQYGAHGYRQPPPPGPGGYPPPMQGYPGSGRPPTPPPGAFQQPKRNRTGLIVGLVLGGVLLLGGTGTGVFLFLMLASGPKQVADDFALAMQDQFHAVGRGETFPARQRFAPLVCEPMLTLIEQRGHEFDQASHSPQLTEDEKATYRGVRIQVNKVETANANGRMYVERIVPGKPSRSVEFLLQDTDDGWKVCDTR